MSQQPYQQGPPPGQYPPYQPQGYPQPPQGPPPGQYPPYGTPPAQPQYQQQWPPPAGVPQGGVPEPGTPVPGSDGFGVPDTRPAAGDQPAIHQLATSNRLVLIRPLRWNQGGTKYNSTEPEEQMIVDMVVCDGAPIPAYIDFASRAETPFAAGPKSAPFFLGSVVINKAIKDRCRSALEDPTTPNTVLGRLSSNTPKSGSGFPWWNLEEPTEEDKQIARPVFASWDQIKAAAAVGPAPVQQQPSYGNVPPAQNYPQPPPQGPPPQGYPQQPQQGPPGGWVQQPGQYPPY